MEQIIEKVLYYDLYGYAVPGSFLLLSLWSKEFISYVICENALRGIPLYALLLLVTAGIVVGMVVTEVADFAYDKLRKDSTLENFIKDKEISVTIVIEALKRVGVNEPMKDNGCSMYLWIMYSAIQTDPEYSRIHNYAASQVLCRNMSVTCCLGGFIIGWKWLGISYGTLIFGIIGIACGVLFFWRECRFREKKDAYTLFWFIQKYYPENS